MNDLVWSTNCLSLQGRRKKERGLLKNLSKGILEKESNCHWCVQTTVGELYAALYGNTGVSYTV